MLKKLLAIWSNDLLIELSESLLVVKVFGDAKKYEIEPFIAIKNGEKYKVVEAIGREAKELNSQEAEVTNPFSHSRLLVADFVKAEKILQHIVQQTRKSRWLNPAPRIVMHQLEKNEGGLTDIELKVLRELALGAGAREVKVHEGKRLNVQISTYDEVIG
ncbi:MAG: rod shape-determining protein MreB [Psychrobacter glaciei]